MRFLKIIVTLAVLSGTLQVQEYRSVEWDTVDQIKQHNNEFLSNEGDEEHLMSKTVFRTHYRVALDPAPAARSILWVLRRGQGKSS